MPQAAAYLVEEDDAIDTGRLAEARTRFARAAEKARREQERARRDKRGR